MSGFILAPCLAFLVNCGGSDGAEASGGDPEVTTGSSGGSGRSGDALVTPTSGGGNTGQSAGPPDSGAGGNSAGGTGGAGGAGGKTPMAPLRADAGSLPDMVILGSKSFGSYSWSQGSTLITTAGSTAFPTVTDKDGQVVLEIKVIAAPTGTGWGGGLPLVADSTLQDLKRYADAGAALELSLEGTMGGESFMVGFQDQAGASGRMELSDYGHVGTSWTVVRIPLADFATHTHGGQVDLSRVASMILQDWPADVMDVSMKSVRITTSAP